MLCDDPVRLLRRVVANFSMISSGKSGKFGQEDMYARVASRKTGMVEQSGATRHIEFQSDGSSSSSCPASCTYAKKP